ncbi:hypothetical protein GCM10027062_16010 [Nocardioides hungaricus]
MSALASVASAVLGAGIGALGWWLYGKLRPGREWLRLAVPLGLLACWVLFVASVLRGFEGRPAFWAGFAGFMAVYVVWIVSGRFHTTSR